MRRSARALLEALSAAGVTISATSRTLLVVRPARAVNDELRAQLIAFKLELLRALEHGQIAACARCDLEFATVPARLCPWCTMTEHASIPPGSRTETEHLAAESARRATVPNCPRVENSERGDSGDSSSIEIPFSHTRARAKGITGIGPQTVPEAETVPTLFDASEAA